MTMISLILIFTCMAPPTMGKIQDMGWPMDMDHISYYSIFRDPMYHYQWEMKQDGPYGPFPFLSYAVYSTVEHAGTHMDAPYHFYKEGKRLHEIPLEDLMGPLVRINISAKAAQDPNSVVEVSDIMDWEKRNGALPDRAIVLMHSGWDRFYGDTEKYLGVTEEGGPLNHPGIGGDASRWLLKNRNILGVGVDTISCDAGNSTAGTHLSILPANKVCFENLRNVDKVPECGARFMMLPINLKNGTGGQGRAFAEWYPGTGYMTNCKDTLKRIGSFFEPSNADKTFEHNSATLLISFRILALTIGFLSLCFVL